MLCDKPAAGDDGSFSAQDEMAAYREKLHLEQAQDRSAVFNFFSGEEAGAKIFLVAIITDLHAYEMHTIIEAAGIAATRAARFVCLKKKLGESLADADRSLRSRGSIYAECVVEDQVIDGASRLMSANDDQWLGIPPLNRTRSLHFLGFRMLARVICLAERAKGEHACYPGRLFRLLNDPSQEFVDSLHTEYERHMMTPWALDFVEHYSHDLLGNDAKADLFTTL